MENYYIQKAIVNGLIATTILWLFWIPFIIIVVIRLLNNQIKDGVCQSASIAGENYRPYEIAYYLYYKFGIDYQEAIQYLRTPFDPEVAKNIINKDPTVISDANKYIVILMIISCIIVTILCIGIAVLMVYNYNLNGWEIVRFNIVMAVIIMSIEAIFFGGVATQYIPFYPNDMLDSLQTKINNYANSLNAD